MNFLKKLIFEILKILFYPFAFFLLILIKIISPFYLIRWHCTISTRIGHYTCNLNLYLCEKEQKIINSRIKTLDIFYDRKVVCNKQLKKMFHRKMLFLPWFIMYPINHLNEIFFEKFSKRKNLHDLGYYRSLDKSEDFFVPPLSNFDKFNVIDKSKIQLEFSDKEISNGLNNLNQMGLNSNSKIVSIVIRDADYLKNKYKNISYQQHSHRDTDLNFYIKAIKYLIENGYNVVIFGNIVEKDYQEISRLENVIFYSRSKYYSDFMDIFLISRSQFVISSITGLDEVPFAFKIPIIEVGVVPFYLQRTYSDLCISLFKNYFSKSLNRNLTMSEIFENNLHSIEGNTYLNNELTFIHPSIDEIFFACKEMCERIENKYIENEENNNNQKKFRELFNYYIKFKQPERITLENKGKVAKEFLKNNLFLLN